VSVDNSAPLKRISLLASSFTGSTLLGIMLSQDKRFLGMGDTYLIPTVTDESHTCCCGKTVIECDFRVKLREQLELLKTLCGPTFLPTQAQAVRSSI